MDFLGYDERPYSVLVLINRKNFANFVTVVAHLLGFGEVAGICPPSAGVPQFFKRPALLEEPSRAFCFLLRQTIQGFLTSEEQDGGGKHVVGDSKRAQHLHWLPAQQSLPSSLSERQRGICKKCSSVSG